jgi:hypothetical protein
MEIGVVRVEKVFFGGCEGTCALVVIHQKEDREKTAVVHIDVSNQRVTSIRASWN